MSHRVVTSFTEKGYEQYGKEFLRTWRKYWPKSVKLTIYYEGDFLREDEENIEWRWYEEVDGLQKWLDSIAPFPVLNGDTGSYNIQYDARQCRKAFIEAYATRKGGKVFWFDADSITHDYIPESFLDEILPDDKFCCYLGRDWFYTESGFIGFNASHPLCEPFMETYLQVFKTGTIFTLKGWHDCYGFDLTRRVVGMPEMFNDLAKDLPEGTMHPLINSVLGAYLDHKKGPRKEDRSTQKDLVVERKEAYWNVSKVPPLTASDPTIATATPLRQAS